MPVDEVLEALRGRQRHPGPVEEEDVEHDCDAEEERNEEVTELEDDRPENPTPVKLLRGRGMREWRVMRKRSYHTKEKEDERMRVVNRETP